MRSWLASKAKVGIERSVWILLTLVLVTFTISWALLKKRTQRLFQLPDQAKLRLLGVRNGEALFLGRDGGSQVQLRARSIENGKTRTVAGDESLSNAFLTQLSDDALYFKVAGDGELLPPGVGVVPQIVPMAPTGGGTISMTVASGDPRAPAIPATSAALGFRGPATPSASVAAGVLPQLNPLAAGQAIIGGGAVADHIPRPPLSLEGAGDPPGSPNINSTAPERVRLRRIDIKTGVVNDVGVALGLNPYIQRDYVSLGDYVYFTRFTKSPPPRTDAPLEKRKTCAVELLRYPVSGGLEEVVKRVPGILSTLYATREKIYWIVARPDYPGKVDLYHHRPGSDEVLSVRDYESWLPPVEAGGRLYWVTRHYVRRNLDLSGVSLDSSCLVSAQLDGADRTIVKRILENGQYLIYMWRPVAYKDRVNVQVSESTHRDEDSERKEALYRVRKDLRDIERVRDLPARSGARGAFIEDGWYYFAVHARGQSLWDSLRNGEKYEQREVLHRIRLPEQ
jgi:hypothetical protein